MSIIGVDRRGMPSEQSGHLDYIVVLTQSEGPEPYAAYIGAGSPEWVADHGDKLSFKQATSHFPVSPMTSKNYRW